MGLYKELCVKELEKPNIDIAIVDVKYILRNNLNVRIEKVENEDMTYSFIVGNQKGDIYFKTKDKFFGRELLTVYDEPIINICGCISNKVKRRIYAGDSESILLGEIRKKDAFRGKKYQVKFNRLGVGKMEYFTMTCDKDMRICTISFDHENGDKRVIGRVVRSIINNDLYEVDIVSGVDIVFIIGIILFFVEMTHLTTRKGYIGDSTMNFISTS
ncbi:hypothetical protein BCR36DRAFT_582745 [Piromyces finnis]|uniref:DUF567-domain-containing protein n=1 Tax=Piromyces finnis TaxID=1754191 RepID=A0A1Y1VBV4_9FUNG|nr:hypothetical protein BCR36DRAFT_582745 [Piromyces finnis]|eukprot:ORX52246.1 hypothetical protein BCR36DRAFT_582745 [Piromyces finnis]